MLIFQDMSEFWKHSLSVIQLMINHCILIIWDEYLVLFFVWYFWLLLDGPALILPNSPVSWRNKLLKKSHDSLGKYFTPLDSNALGIEEARKTIGPRQCPVTRDKTEVSAGQSSFINLIYRRECELEGLRWAAGSY